MVHPYNKDALIDYDIDQHLKENGYTKNYDRWQRGIYGIEFNLFTINVTKSSEMGYTDKMGFKASYKNNKYLFNKPLVCKAIKLVDFLSELEQTNENY